MPDPVSREPSSRSSGQGGRDRSPPRSPQTGAGAGAAAWGQPASRPPTRYVGSPGGAYYPPDQPLMTSPARTATRPPVTPAAQRPRPPAGPVQRDQGRRDGVRGDGAAPPPPAARKTPVVRGVRSRRLIRRFDILSVFKVSLIFYICVFIVMIIAGAALWNVAAAFGVITDTDKLVRSLFALTTFTLHPITALLWGSLIAGAVCFLGVLFNVFAAVVYNLISDVVGGVQVIVVTDQGHEETV
jgi:hypothetical protein